MANDVTTKWYYYTNTGAPTLDNVYGSMISVLDACLVNGFGSQQVQSVTYDANNVCTLTFLAAHNFRQYQVIEVSGNVVAAFNGQFRILTVPNSTTVTVQLNSTPTGTSSGTVTAKLPPLGWSKPYSSTAPGSDGGRAAYRSNNTLLSSRPYLRVVDERDPLYDPTWAKYAKVAIVEEMTAINNMAGVQSPYDSTDPDKNWVGKGTAGQPGTIYNGYSMWMYARGPATTTSGSDSGSLPVNGNRQWLLVGTSDYFYIFNAFTPTNQSLMPYGFGNFRSYVSTDNACTFLSSTNRLTSWAANTSYYPGTYNPLGTSMYTNGILFAQRPASGAAQPGTCYTNFSSLSSAGSMQTGAATLVAGPNVIGISPFFTTYVTETSSTPIQLRGELYGYYCVLQQRPFTNMDIMVRDGGIFMALDVAAGSSITGQAVVKIGDL